MKRAVAAVVVLVGIGLITIAIASDTPPAPKTRIAGEPLVTQFYDIRDLIQYIPDFAPPEPPLPTQAVETSGETNLFGTAQKEYVGPTREEVVDQIAKSIMAIDPDSWKDANAGGTADYITDPDRRMLIINQTPANQKRIGEFLSQYRKAFLPTSVRIRAHWIMARRSDLEAGLRPVESGPATRPAASDAGSSTSALLQADETSLDKIAGAVHFRGEVVCLTGQRVCLSAANTRTTTTVTVDANNHAMEQSFPQTGGLILDVTNTPDADRTGTLLIIRSQWRNPLASPQPPTHVGDSAEFTDGLHALRTSVRVPLRKNILIGGMTLDPRPSAAPAKTAQAGEEPVQMYLFVEATAQKD
jgi:hypothetical protein